MTNPKTPLLNTKIIKLYQFIYPSKIPIEPHEKYLGMIYQYFFINFKCDKKVKSYLMFSYNILIITINP